MNLSSAFMVGTAIGLTFIAGVELGARSASRRWIPSARALPDGTHIPVRQTREAPPNERYQEWRAGRWVDVPYEERGPRYMETYPR